MEINKTIMQDAVDFSVESITKIIDDIGPREPGSKQERAAQEYLIDIAKKNNWADEYVTEEFQVAPKAFMGFIWFCPILIALGWAFFLVSPIITFVLVVAALAVLVLEFGMYKQFLDPLYKKATSANMMAVKKAKGETKRRIIIDGHPDSAYEWEMFNLAGMFGLVIGPVLSIVGAFFSLALCIYYFVMGDVTFIGVTANGVWWLVFLPWIFLPGLILLTRFSNYNRLSPGANDNLTGCMAAMSVLKYLKEAGIEYENTEVIGMLGGSEEAGLRGAKDWAKRHAAEIKASGIETVFIAVDTLRDLEHMSIYIRDLTGTVKNSTEVCNLLAKGAVKTGRFEKPLPWASVYIGASDAAAITQAGLPAATLAAMDPNPPRYYHTRHDTADILRPECMEAGYDVLLQAIEEFDQNGLK